MTSKYNSEHLGFKKHLNHLYQNKTERRGDCLLWTGGKSTKEQYPVTQWMGKYQNVYRLIWEHHNGPIPEGMVFSHSCGNTSCIKLAHLESTIRKAKAA